VSSVAVAANFSSAGLAIPFRNMLQPGCCGDEVVGNEKKHVACA
jgi:hypothetical protein